MKKSKILLAILIFISSTVCYSNNNKAEIFYNQAISSIKNGHETKAIHFFQKAAKLGHAESQYMLGAAHARGRGGLEVDYLEAVRWFCKRPTCTLY